MNEPSIIAALGTPLDADENLHLEGLAAQLERLWAAGVPGVFAAGTMGAMPLLTDDVYAALVKTVTKLARGRCELLVGAGDLSLARTRRRIEYINEFKVDGVVVLPPYFMRFSQAELVDYYQVLADESRAPLYLYDLPQRTFTHIDNDTALRLAEHPNIAGIKSSGDLTMALDLMQSVADRQQMFRVLVAQPDDLFRLVGKGVMEHLDGMYCLAPEWTMRIARGGAPCGDTAERLQQELTVLRTTMRQYGGFPALTALMNACGVPGCFAPRPYALLTPADTEALLEEPVVRRFLGLPSRRATESRNGGTASGMSVTNH